MTKRQDTEPNPIRSLPALVDKCRALIKSSVPILLESYAASVGLPSPTPKFQADVSEAILVAAALAWDAPKRKRFSVLSKEMLRVQEAASKSAKALSDLNSALQKLTPLYRDALHGYPRLGVLKIVPTLPSDLDALSNYAEMYADKFKSLDKGGAAKMLEFEMLVRGLARSFENATGKAGKATWHPIEGEYGGDFLALVQTVIPLTLTCSEMFGSRMSVPRSPFAVGKYIYEATRAGRSMTRTPYHIS
jgi:hypothetical protein